MAVRIRPEGTLFQLAFAFLLLISAAAAVSSRPSSHRVRQEPSYMKFVSNATDFPQEDYYDYIIVGGGTAGCPLAATLSSGFRVLLLERGGIAYGNRNLMTQEGFLASLVDFDSFDSATEAFMSEDGVPNVRGRILGGSSAINAGFYSRADPEFYRRSGFNWDLALVNQSYEWVEEAIVYRPELRNWQSAFRDSLLQAGVDPYNGYSFDHIVGTKTGGSTFDNFGRRHSAADLLTYANPSNIQVVVHATVERVLLASSTSSPDSRESAVGVVFRDTSGKYHHAMLRKHGEVLLSAGAIGTPQLLLLSGIGSRPYLASWGIPVAHHLPYVGQFMYDNPRNGISFVPPIPLEQSLIQVVGITESGAYIESASTVIPFASPARYGLFRTASAPLFLTVVTIMEKIIGPDSFGSLRLASIDVRVNPIVQFNYFNSSVDVQRCVNGTRKIGEILRTRPMDDFKFQGWFGNKDFRVLGPALPLDQFDFDQMADFCRRTLNTIWHYHGGCIAEKVIDRDFRVIGIDALRVVDGSTFDISPGTNPQATLLMLGRYVGQKIMDDRMGEYQMEDLSSVPLKK